MQKPEFVEDEFYHIYNRGVEKRTIFTTDADRYRFLRSLYFCNDESPATNSYRGKDNRDAITELCEVEPRTVRELLVKIHAYILMPNHFHMILEQVAEDGIRRFMQKLGTAYTMYFNIKHNKRVGSLFQGRFKAVLVDEESQLNYLPYYIHASALDLADYKWREGKLSNPKAVMEYLDNYKWSSHQDYSGVSNYPSIIDMSFLPEIIGSEKEYRNDFKEWLFERASEDAEEVEFE